MRLQHTKDSSVLTHHTLCALCVGVLLLVCAVTAQEVETGCEGEADIVFAIDASRYTREDRFEESRDFIRSVILRLQVRSEQTRVGIISLGDEENYYTMQLGQFTDRVLMVNYVDREVQYRGGNIDYEQFLNFTQNEAFLQSVGGRDVVPNVLVLIMSDVAMYESRNYRSRIERLRESGVNVISYVYGDDVSESRLSDPMRRWSPEPRARFLTARARDLRMEQLSMESRDTEGRSTFMTTLCQEVPSCAGAADITFVLDSSGSVGFDNWQTVQDFCTSIVNEMNIGEDGVRIAAISFSTTSSVEFDLTRYHTKYQLDQALHELSFFEGYTNTSGALRTMRTRVYTRAAGDRLSRQDIAIVISDGASTEEKGQLAAEAREVHNYGIFTFAIAINIGRNNPAFLDEMHTIASDDNSVFELGSFTSLEQIENRLVSRTCRPVAPVCNRNLDVIFMLDASGSISRDDFLRIINFVRELASRLDIDGGAARVGMLTFATVPEVVFHLRDYDTISEVTRAMQGVEFTRGLTHTHTALSFVLETMFSEEYGSRPDVDRVLLVVTDGDSSDPVQTIDMCRQIRSEGIDILTVGIGDDWVSVPELQAMSSFPKNRNSFVVEEYEDLFEISDHMLRTICDLVDECESDPCANAGQCQDGINSYYCECRSGFTGRDCSESCPNVADVVFLLDSSGSIERESFNVMQEFIRDVLFGLNVDVGTRVGVLQFSTSTDVVFHLNEYSTTRDVLQALNLRYTGGRTNTAEAIRVARTSMFTEANGDREGIPNIIILLTDGKSNEREATLAEALEARKDGIHISVIGVGQSVGQGELENIATDPDDRNLYMVRDFNALRSILDNLLVGVCNSEDECEDDPCDQGECVDGINTYTCACEPGFTGRHCDRSCSTAADIAFMIDASGSIQRDNFERVLHFAKNLVLQMAAEGNPDQIHLSVGSFADQPSINLRFDEYSEPEDVFHALDSLTFDGGETNVHLALQLIKTQMFDIQRGDRANVPNYVILLTDGVPNLDRELTVPSAIELHIAGIHVILVLIGPGLNSGWNYLRMHAIASEPYEQNIFFGDFNTIFDLIPDVADALCNEADECESDPCQNGGQCQDGLYQYRCQCSERFTGVNCERRCSTQLDIIFLVDISGSIEGNYDKEVSFMKRIVSGLNYAFRRTRTGMIKFAGTAEIGFTLDAYDSSQDVLNALPISDIGINTNIAAGLNLVIEEGFVLRNGDRPGIDNVLITLTDGKANIQVERVEDELDDLQCAGPTNLRRFTIGIGESVNRQMIERLSCSPTNSYAYYIPTRNDVDTVADRVLQELCT